MRRRPPNRQLGHGTAKGDPAGGRVFGRQPELVAAGGGEALARPVGDLQDDGLIVDREVRRHLEAVPDRRHPGVAAQLEAAPLRRQIIQQPAFPIACEAEAQPGCAFRPVEHLHRGAAELHGGKVGAAGNRGAHQQRLEHGHQPRLALIRGRGQAVQGTRGDVGEPSGKPQLCARAEVEHSGAGNRIRGVLLQLQASLVAHAPRAGGRR